MSPTARLTALLLALALPLAGLSACGGSSHRGIPATAVAAVEGAPITAAEVSHWLAVAALSHSTGALAKGAVAPDPPDYTACIRHIQEVARTAAPGHPPSVARVRRACEEQYATLRERALAFLIAARWGLAEGRSRGIDPSTAEVQRRFEAIKAQRFPTPAEEQSLLSHTGETVADLLFQTRLDMVNERISREVAGAARRVSDKELGSYYDQHRSEFEPKEALDVRLILTRGEGEAHRVRREIEAGKSFAAVANAATIETAGKRVGGLATDVVRGERPPPLDRALFAARTGVLSGPVKTVIGYYVFEVLHARSVPAKTLAQVRPEITSRIVEPREAEALKRFAAGFERRWRQRTECRSGWVVAECGRFAAASQRASTQAP